MQRKTRQSAPTLKKKHKQRGPINHELLLTLLVIFLFLILAGGALVYEFYSGPSSSSSSPSLLRAEQGGNPNTVRHLQDKVPVLPIFAPVPDAERLIDDTISGKQPTMAGIVALLQKFVAELHSANRRLSKTEASPAEITRTLFDLTSQYLGRFDGAYRGKPIFPIREDGSIFLSLAAFREGLLADTLKFALQQAKHPDKLYVGAVVQNCFGKVLDDEVTIDTSGLPCKTGRQVIGKNKQGRDKTKVSDAPPDPNGIEDFCNMPEFKKYCDNGQIRVLYVHETESLGPAMARYYASKLWGGETYFVQMDSHLMFANEWDEKYRLEIKATRNYPKSVLSSYPPGFDAVHNNAVRESSGSRLCACNTRKEDPNPIVRINTGRGYIGNEPRPTQIPFIAAGFFFTRAEFLVDIPFDPFMPWLFMGEEIALSMRAWTHGWDIYAPRKNLIAHQYRPGRMGLPKFWGTVDRLYKAGSGTTSLQARVIQRIKNMVGYPDATLEKIDEAGIQFVLKDIEHYGLGTVRTWDEYMDHAKMSIDKEHDIIVCKKIEWCNKGLKD